MARKTMSMFRTFKADIFNTIVVDGKDVPVVSIIGDRLVINNDCCDLRTIKDRYDPQTKELAPSVVNCISAAESIMTMHYSVRMVDEYFYDDVTDQTPDPDTVVAAVEYNTLYDFITVDCSEGNDTDQDVKRIKELLCFDGLYLPLPKLEAIGYVPHDEVEIVEIEGVEHVRYRAALQSASENRQCKMTMTTYKWDNFAKTISGDARYLYEPTQTPQKAISRQGLGKSNGNIITGFHFSFAVVPDLETEITFPARCFNDKRNEITAETITMKKVATDGCGFITPFKARELASRLGLSYLPSAFQVRYGQVKGILLVFDFQKYTNGVIKEDILFTESMKKSDFDTDKAQFLVANVSKLPRSYTEWNYQMLTTLNSSLSFDDILPYVEDIKAHMKKALISPEAALKFLGILSDISSLTGDDDKDGYDCIDKVSAVIQANPQLAMNILWVRQSIKKKIDLVSKKMLFGKIPMPQSNVCIMAPDPLAFFNRLCIDHNGNYSFSITDGKPVVPTYKMARELAANEFGYGDYQEEILATRNPLTHYAQIRKLKCVSHKDSAYWYRHLDQVVIFNSHDETVLGMGGADHDGDMCIITKLFTDKFQQADFIILNANDTGDKQAKVVLTEEVVQHGILANLQPNMLGIICNINTRCLELMNDPAALRKFVMLAGYTGDRSFGIKETPQMPYKPKFLNEQEAMTYLEMLNHQLTTLSELEVDRPKTGYINRFFANQQEYALPFTPYWFANIKGQLEKFQKRPPESSYKNKLDEHVRTLTKKYNDGRTIKTIVDTKKTRRMAKGHWVQRTIEMMADGDTIMCNLQRYIQEQILDMEIDANNCFSIVESLKSASILDMNEVERITGAVQSVFKAYCQDISGNIRAMKNRAISQDDFDKSLESIITFSDERLRDISTDRAALAYAAYVLSIKNGYGSQSFPFLTVVDGMCALLNDVRTTDFYEINLYHEIPHNLTHLLGDASHVIVYNRQIRLPEIVDPSKSYFGDVSLANGCYEVYRDLKGGISLIIPKSAPKNKLHMVPFNENAEFSIKVSYKASELRPDHQNGEYVTSLMADRTITFMETTMAGNTQYCVYANDIWVGTVFDDQRNNWVLRKAIIRTLLGNDYVFSKVPHIGVKTNANSFVTGTGKARTAQILTFVQAKPVQEQMPLATPVSAA